VNVVDVERQDATATRALYGQKTENGGVSDQNLRARTRR
jgi:hypothetical protein